MLLEYHRVLQWAIFFLNIYMLTMSVMRVLYSDDTAIIYLSSGERKLYRDTNEALEACNQWFCASKLCLDVTYTKNIVVKPPTTLVN